MNLNVMRLFAVMAALVVLAQSAVAGPLPTDANAIPGWQGSSFFTGVNAGFTLKVDVEYAVYAPGNFTWGGSDPSGGTDYVYAYEAIVDPTGTARMSSLSVGLAPGAVPVGSTNIGFVGGVPVGGVAPTLSQLIPLGNVAKSSAKWSFLSPVLNPNQHSYVLLFTSPHAPQMILASMIGGNATFASNALPSPTPEPASVLLGGFGLIGLVAVGLRRKARGR